MSPTNKLLQKIYAYSKLRDKSASTYERNEIQIMRTINIKGIYYYVVNL